MHQNPHQNRHRPTDSNLKPPPLPKLSPAAKRRQRIAGVKSWRYQLRRIEIEEIAASSADLIVIDYAPDRVYGVELPFSRADVTRMRRKPDGSHRILLAYLSIGEAERYRTYWNNAWYDAPTRPIWLLGANTQWDGNFPVRFWNPEWQDIVFGRPSSYLDRILAAGFDGLYLDRADVFQELETERPSAERDMAQFIVRLVRHARRKFPEAIVVMQNAEELARRPEIVHAIDAIAKEDLFYGVDHNEGINEAAMIRDTLADLRYAQSRGLTILTVEYLSSLATISVIEKRARSERFVPLFAERSLGTLDYQPAAAPARPAIENTAPIRRQP